MGWVFLLPQLQFRQGCLSTGSKHLDHWQWGVCTLDFCFIGWYGRWWNEFNVGRHHEIRSFIELFGLGNSGWMVELTIHCCNNCSSVLATMFIVGRAWDHCVVLMRSWHWIWHRSWLRWFISQVKSVRPSTVYGLWCSWRWLWRNRCVWLWSRPRNHVDDRTWYCCMHAQLSFVYWNLPCVES